MDKKNNIDIDNDTKEKVEWLKENGDVLRDILEETEDFIHNRVMSEDFHWINTDMNEAYGFILFILSNKWGKEQEE